MHDLVEAILMATYLYNCPACEQDRDVVRAMSDDTVPICGVCGDAALRRVFTAPCISFVGSGFYSTDS